MSPGRRTATLLASLAGLLAMGLAADEPPGPEAVAALPLVRRQALARNLERFDALPPAEQAALRRLDREVGDQPATDRDRYLAVARRYHLWVQTLPPEKQRALAEAPAGQRIDLVRRYRDEQRHADPKSSPSVWIQASSLNPIPLLLEAYQLTVWSRLDRDRRKELEQVRDPVQRSARISEYGRELQVLDALRDVDNEFQAEFSKLQEKSQRSAGPFAAAKKAINLRRIQARDQSQLPPKVDQALRRLDARFLRDHEPAPARPEKLAQFEAELPSWIRDALDPLPPDAARRRLHILYRLVYPPGSEIARPEPKGGEARPSPGGGARGPL